MKRVLAPGSLVELEQILHERPGPLRLLGSGSRQARLPEPGALPRLQLGNLATIERLDAPDQTCTVQCGVPRAELDAALLPHRLELPCPGGGTIGGLFAADPIGAAGPGGASPRTLLLGIEGLLADGTPFRSGAKVVKSVAGFDVHRLLVGSSGRLFLATRLHLRLRPKPPATVWFQNGDLDEGAAITLVQRLRQQPQAPLALQLQRDEHGRCEVRGRLGGRPVVIREQMRALGLREAPQKWLDHLPPPLLGEILSGNILPTTLATVLGASPAGSTLLWHGGGRFELGMANPAATDRVLELLPELKVDAQVIHGSNQRRGLGTLPDSGAERLMQGLKKAFDPHGILV